MRKARGRERWMSLKFWFKPWITNTQEIHSDNVRWVVNDMGELGVEIHGQCLFCYKGRSISYADDPTHDDGTPILVREVGKREFGETVWPLSWHKVGTSQERYEVDAVYTPGLSLGEPDNPRYQWKPLPSLENAEGMHR